METTIGSILLNDTLPPDMRDYSQSFDKGAVKKRLTQLAREKPNLYAHTVHKIKAFGDKVAYDQGASLSLKDLIPIKEKHNIIDQARKLFEKSKQIQDKDIKNSFILDNIVGLRSKMEKTLKEKTLKDNRLTMQVASGARGNISQLNSMIGAPLLYADHRDRPINVLIEKNFSEGLTPVEYWASSYGTRKGTVSTALGTAISGAFSKELNRAADTLIVTEDDCGTINGISEPIDDNSLIGRYLAGVHKRLGHDTLITPEIVDTLRNLGYKHVKVRSPITCEAEKGICAKCRGITEYNRLPVIGENLGIASAQTVTEPITQSALSTKHTGGLAGRQVLAGNVLEMSKRMLNIPKNFVDETPLAVETGRITDIQKAPQGGYYIIINGDKSVYIRPNLKITVKQGDEVESGDALVEEEGTLINPAQLIKYKGLGEGRKYFVDKFSGWLSGKGIDKRHFEVLSRAILNKAIITQDKAIDQFTPDDIIDYTYAVKQWKPEEIKNVSPQNSVGKYLTKNIGHHLAGTKIRKSFIKDFKGLKEVQITEEEPPFEPFAVRINDIPKVSLDWGKRLAATFLKTSILDATRRGMLSSEHNEAFVLPLASGKSFGKTRASGRY